MEFTKILKEPNKISKKQISYLKSIIDDFPYLQSSRAIYLKALKESDSFKFNSELKITAAYSTERNVLFDFITKNEFNEVDTVSKDSGKTIKLTVKVFSGMFMETSMKVIGREIRPMDMVNILTVMEPHTRVYY